MFFIEIITSLKDMDNTGIFLVSVLVSFSLMQGSVQIPKIFKKKRNKKTSNSLVQLLMDNPNYPTLTAILEKSMEKSDEITKIKYIDVIYEQMTEAELVTEEIKEILSNSLDEMLDPIDELSKSEKEIVLLQFEIILENMENSFIGIFRKWMKRNHFLDKTPIEFNVYIQDKIEISLKRFKRYFEKYNSIIYDKRNFQDNDFYLRFEKCCPEIEKKLIILFNKVKEIGLKKREEIEKIKKEII